MLHYFHAEHVIEASVGKGNRPTVVIHDIRAPVHAEFNCGLDIETNVLSLRDEISPRRFARADIEDAATKSRQDGLEEPDQG